MHIHSRDWRSAIRVAEKYLPEAVMDVLLSQSSAALESRNYLEYEALLIRAERPDIILQHYKENEMWSDAIRIAEEYMPSALSEIQQLRNKANAVGGASNDSRQLLQQASEYARNEEFRKAVDCLLQINESNADATMIERALVRAAEICNQFLEGNNAKEVAQQLAPRLVNIGQIGLAAQLFLAAEMPKEAVDVFVQSENWNKARRLAKEFDQDLQAYVETQQKSRLRSDGNIEQLADIGIILFLNYFQVNSHAIINYHNIIFQRTQVTTKNA